jgi:phosphoserine aminotransferase
MSVLEMNHRCQAFTDLTSQIKQNLREVMQVPDSHSIFFTSGGASMNYSAIPMNLCESSTSKSLYLVSG